jgi:hypothetical protein
VEVALAGGTLACALAAAAVVLPGRGWPFNHDALSAFERTEWFRRAFLAGDLFPTWTPFCFNGHGTAGPFFYHRLFYSASGLVAAAGASSLGAVIAATVAFLALGGAGMARLGRALGWPAPLRLAAAALLVTAPYTYTDWLVRGALAELSAGMLVPWLFLAALRVARGSGSPARAGAALGAAWALLFYAHLVIWLYATFVVALAFALALLRRGRAGRRRDALVSLVVTGAVLVAATGVYALAIRRLGRHFSLEQLRLYYPTEMMQPPKRYLTVPMFAWGEEWRRFSIEIGRAVLLALALLGALAIARGARVGRAVLPLLGGTALAFFALQLEVAAPFYRKVPLADVIQFPWRLVTFLAPAAIALACELAAAVARRACLSLRLAVAAIVLAALASHAALSYRAQRIRYPWWSRDEIARGVEALDGPWAGREFLAKGVDPVPPRAPFVRADGCAARAADGRDLAATAHFVRVELEVDAPPRGCVLHVSQFATPFVGVEGEGATPSRAPDGTLDVAIAPGQHRLALVRRGVVAALRADLAAR